MKTVIFAIFCVAAMSDAGAVMYKSVGPDGKVTFSDRPPAGETGQLSIMGSAGFKPADVGRASSATASASVDNAKVADVMARSKAEAKARAAAKPHYEPTSPDRAGRPSPELAEALSKAMGNASLARQTRELCIATLPTSFARYQGSYDKWAARHSAVLADIERVLTSMPGRSDVEHAVDDRVGAIMKPVTAAPMYSRIKWCDKSFAELDSGALDFASRDAITKPLRAFDRK